MPRFARILATCILLGPAVMSLAADPNKDAIDDPSKAGPSYAMQGEYVGEVPGDGKMKKLGLQVIALGDGKYRAVAYHGGLPGDGWDKGEKIITDGKEENGAITFKSERGTGVIQNGVLTASDPDGNKVGELKKVERKSPTLGAKPSEGAVVLFDGSTADKFENGRLTEDKLLMQGVTSKQKFQSFTLHMEFRTPYMPAAAGQARGNSGCYMQGRYEVQILDSFGLEGKNNECGGIYEPRDPDVNMCLPPLVWQTYDVDYTAAKYDAAGKKTAHARITVKHNGVLIHDNVELPKATRGNPVAEGPEPGPVYIQDHGNPVRLRNIWLVEKKG